MISNIIGIAVGTLLKFIIADTWTFTVRNANESIKNYQK